MGARRRPAPAVAPVAAVTARSRRFALLATLLRQFAEINQLYAAAELELGPVAHLLTRIVGVRVELRKAIEEAETVAAAAPAGGA